MHVNIRILNSEWHILCVFVLYQFTLIKEKDHKLLKMCLEPVKIYDKISFSNAAFLTKSQNWI